MDEETAQKDELIELVAAFSRRTLAIREAVSFHALTEGARGKRSSSTFLRKGRGGDTRTLHLTLTQDVVDPEKCRRSISSRTGRSKEAPEQDQVRQEIASKQRGCLSLLALIEGARSKRP